MDQIFIRAQELSETNTQMDLLPMIPADQKFDMSFWSAVLQKTGEEDSWEYEGQYIPDRLTVCLPAPAGIGYMGCRYCAKCHEQPVPVIIPAAKTLCLCQMTVRLAGTDSFEWCNRKS